MKHCAVLFAPPRVSLKMALWARIISSNNDKTGRRRRRTAAFNNDSDAMVAIVLLKDTPPAAAEPAILELLNGAQAQRWVKMQLGLKRARRRHSGIIAARTHPIVVMNRIDRMWTRHFAFSE